MATKKKTSIPNLIQDDVTVTTDEGKAEVLNVNFSRSFNYSVPPLDQECSFFTASGILDYLLCTVDEVEHLLSSVDPSKASGPDGISARMLRATAAGIAPAVTASYNLSLIRGQLPND